MAGELILPHGHGLRSVDYTAPAAGKRGDLVELPDGVGFLLGDVSANGVVAVGIDAAFVTVPQPDTARAWKAGEAVWLDHDRKVTGPTMIARWGLGYVHHDTPDTEARVPVVWAPREGHFYEALNPRTTPAFQLPGGPVLTGNAPGTITKDGGQLVWRLARTSTKGIRPGVPIVVDYEGDILVTGNTSTNFEFAIGYELWRNVAAKRATVWRIVFRDGSKRASEIGLSMDSFSNQSILDVGVPIPNDDGGVTMVTAADFEDGIEVDIHLRLRAFAIGDHSTALNKPVRIDYLEIEHPQVVTSQTGARLQ